MAQHTHDVYDTGKYFEINGISRFIKETSDTKLVLVQGDHNSEVITFQMPRYIDGHDMLLCNKIRVHYINLDTKTNDKSADIYEVTDLALCEECEDETLTFTWKIEAPATKYYGSLAFLIKFECTEGENILYQWNTAKYVGVNVLAGIDNGEEFVDKYSNVLEEWYNELTSGADSIEELNQQALAEIEHAKEDAISDANARIDAKADETLASIPEKYTAMDTSVKQLKDDSINQTKKIDNEISRSKSVDNEHDKKFESLENVDNNHKERIELLENGGFELKEDFLSQEIERWLNKHPEATTTVQDGSLTWDKFSKDALYVVTPQMFGAKGDGVTDDTEAIKKACESVKDNTILYFPCGVYIWNPTKKDDTLIDLNQLNNIIISSDGAKIKTSQNVFTHYNIIRLTNCNNVIVRDITLQGDRLTHDYVTNSGTHEFGHGIFIIGNDENFPVNIQVLNCNIFDMTGDAIVTKNGLSGGLIKVDNCELHHCRRQGISILDSDIIEIFNTNIHHIGSFDGIKGALPKSGIDIEPTSGSQKVNYVKLYNCAINNTGYASIVGSPNELIIDNCKLADIAISNNECNGYIINSIFKTDTVRRHYFNCTNLNIINCNIDVEHYDINEVQTEIWANSLINCNIKGVILEKENGDKISTITTRTKAVKCMFEGVMLKSAGGDNMIKEQIQNTYKGCFFFFYSAPTHGFVNCYFEDCTRNENYNPTITFNNCVIDKKFFTSVLNNTTVINKQ